MREEAKDWQLNKRGASLAANYVLIDFENIQPSNFELLRMHSLKVIIFVGANQNRIPFELAAAMQSMGDAAQYIKMGSIGKNALDFHIAFYVGELAAKDPDAFFYIVSRDTGFDTLIKHLKVRKIKVQRVQDLDEIKAYTQG